MGAFTLIPLIVLIAIGVAIGVATRPKNRKRGRELEFTVDPEVERRGAQAEKYLAFQNDVQALTDQIVALCLEYSPTIGAPALFQAMIVILSGHKPGPTRKQAIAEIQFGVQHLEFHVEEYHKGLFR